MNEKGIAAFLTEHAASRPVSFHMPGHKGREIYTENGYGDFLDCIAAVSYTHLDVYKRQAQEDDLTGKASARLLNTVGYIREKGPYPAWSGTGTKYYPLGDDAFEDMLLDLKNAEHFIFLEYFIISEGKMWDSIFEILKEKAAAGLDVRCV